MWFARWRSICAYSWNANRRINIKMKWLMVNCLSTNILDCAVIPIICTILHKYVSYYTILCDYFIQLHQKYHRKQPGIVCVDMNMIYPTHFRCSLCMPNLSSIRLICRYLIPWILRCEYTSSVKHHRCYRVRVLVILFAIHECIPQKTRYSK